MSDLSSQITGRSGTARRQCRTKGRTIVNLNSAGGVPAPPDPADRRTRAMLGCAIVGGPLFVVILVIQGLSRPGFDLKVTPLSQLSLGDRGWIQITNLVVSGILFGAAALGMRRALRSGRARARSPLLVAVFAASQLLSGAFVPDHGYEFPPGAPVGAPEQLSWHGTVHLAGVTIGGWALIAACLIYARRVAGFHQQGWAAYCLATAATDIVLTVAGIATDDYRLALAGHALIWLWPTVIAMRPLRAGDAQPAEPPRPAGTNRERHSVQTPSSSAEHTLGGRTWTRE